MGLRNWLANIGHAVNAEYDRRIKRASGVVEYGAHHHEHGHPDQEAEGTRIHAPSGVQLPQAGDDVARISSEA